MIFHFTRSIWIRFSLLVSACCMPFTGYAVSFTKRLKQQRVLIVNQYYQRRTYLNDLFKLDKIEKDDYAIKMAALEKRRTLCSYLQSELAVDYSLKQNKKSNPRSSILEENEIAELELDTFVSTFPRITCAGHWAHEHLLVSTNDSFVIAERQKIIKALVDNKQVRDQMIDALHKLSESEKDFLSFWDSYEVSSAGSLHIRAQRLYFGDIFQSMVGKDINHNKYALEVSTLFEMAYSTRNLLLYLGIGHMFDQFALFPFTGKFNIKESFTDGFWGVLGKFSPRRWKTNDPYSESVREPTGEEAYDKMNPDQKEACENLRRKTFIDAIHYGTFADQVYAISHNVDCTDKLWLPYFGDIVGNHKFTKDPSTFRFLEGFTFAGINGGVRGYLLYEGIKNSYQNWKELFGVIRSLQKRMQKVGAFVQQFAQLYKIIKGVPGLEKLANKINMAHCSYSQSMKDLLKTLQSDTFKESNSIFYQRGKVLAAFKQMDELKQELAPLIQATAELDMYVNLAALFDNEDAQGSFCFVEFTESGEPYMEIKDGWIPFLIKGNDIVTNSVTFGNGDPSHKIITGPNGGGKTTTLKMIGYNVVLAQSVGIAAASSMKMTVLDSLRTSFNPREDLQNDISHFMAQKRRMDDILEHACTRSAHKKILFLIDEPFGGTVDASTAARTYQFGEYLAPLSNVMSCLATHVKKPITLADMYPGSFENYQIEIQSLENGVFKRTFKLLPGPALWWFDDHNQRDEFIDWLSTQIKR